MSTRPFVFTQMPRRTRSNRGGVTHARVRPAAQMQGILDAHKRSAHKGRYDENCAACRELCDELNQAMGELR
jgi:hypothetical protein